MGKSCIWYILNPQSTVYGTNLSLGAVKLSHVWNIVTTYSMYLNALRTLIEVEVIQSGPLHLWNWQEVERTRTSEMFMLYFTWPYCKQLASNVKLATGKYKIISRQLGSFEVLFNRPAEVSVAMGEWATVNFCPCIPIPYWNSRWFVNC
jgi:hypothetical protein